MARERKKHSDENESDSSSSNSDTSLSSGASVSSDSTRRRRKRRRRERPSDSDTDCSSSDDDDESSRRRKKRRSKHKRDKERSGRKKKHDHRSSSRKKKRARRHHHHDHHDDEQEDDSSKGASQASKLQVTMDAREQEKNLIYQNAELAKARLNGELREVQAQQAKLQDMYGTIDWRARKKLRIEKKKLERSVAAGKKLAQIEEEESARMDAFRIALGLPTAEAQRQAEWRAQATRALSCQEPAAAAASRSPSKPPKKNIIGPQLPR